MTAEATTEKARVGAPSIAGFTEEGEHLVASKVDRHHSHGTQVMASRAERLTSHDVADFALPNGREEEWRFTPVRELANLLSDTPSEAGALGVTVEAPAAVVQRTLRAGEAPRGATLVPADRAAVVASANAGDAQLISIPANAELDEPVRLVLTGNGAGRRTNSHVVIEAGVNSRSVVIIEHDGTSDHNGNVEVLVREGAHLTVVSLQLWGGRRQAPGTA